MTELRNTETKLSYKIYYNFQRKPRKFKINKMNECNLKTNAFKLKVKYKIINSQGSFILNEQIYVY